DDVRVLLGELQRLLTRGRFPHLEACMLKHQASRVAVRLFVVHDQDRCLGVHGCEEASILLAETVNGGGFSQTVAARAGPCGQDSSARWVRHATDSTPAPAQRLSHVFQKYMRGAVRNSPRSSRRAASSVK